MALQDKNYLALTLIGEARGEPIEGIIGVANVIKNRSYAYRKTYKDVCLAPLQFSCWNFTDPNYSLISKISSDLEAGNTILDPYIRQCLAVGDSVYNGDFLDNVKGSKNYVTQTRLNLALGRRDPKLDGWIIKMRQVCILGHHIFLIDL